MDNRAMLGLLTTQWIKHAQVKAMLFAGSATVCAAAVIFEDWFWE